MKRIYVFTNASAPSESTTRSSEFFPLFLSLSLLFSLLLSAFLTHPSFRLSCLPCYLNGPSLIASLESTAKPWSLLLCNESGITARRELSKFIRPMRSRHYESPLDRPTRNFIRYTPDRPRRTLRGISRQRARTDEHNHRAVPPE